MHEIDNSLLKALDPLSVATELNRIASRHRRCGNHVKRGAFGMVYVLFSSGEAHYYPSARGIELRILKYDAQERWQRKPSIQDIQKVE